MTKCCMECFSDRVMRQKVARQSSAEGYCERCATPRATLLECSELSSEFSILLSLYEVREDGEHLSALVARDWAIFADGVADKASLIDALLPGTVAQKFVAALPIAGVSEGRWVELKNELKVKNRFFPSSAPDRDELSQLLGLLLITQDAISRVFYRARIQRDENPFELKDLKAPPLGVAQAGRANPPGLSYLYVAGDQETAVLEVRPTVADLVTICKFEAAREFKLVDLTDPRSLISPFGVDTSTLGNVQASMGLLEMLSQDLTRPTPPHKAATDYLATQYLCELIKTLGYDGVRYRSSLKEGGDNFAFFDVDALIPVALVQPIEIAGVKLEYA
ncbi:hypothetical protein XarbCFBP7408_20615 [Xanthomonas arboricola pv. guizotiae]|nr:hypothetical protein XarbCFBP7408_20615 [Xanthomonas arboricola pv. guizotiae]